MTLLLFSKNAKLKLSKKHKGIKMLREELQSQIQAGNSNQFIRQFREMYINALNSLDNDIQKLYDDGKDMHAIRQFSEQTGIILNTEESLKSMYSLIFMSGRQLEHYGSKNNDLTRLPMLSFWNDDTPGMEKFFDLSMDEFRKNMSLYVDRETDEVDHDLIHSNITDMLLSENGYGEREHWYIKSSLLNEIDYMLDFLEVFLEEDYMPIEENSEEDEKPNRHIPKDVKVSVWRRDKGQCVQCSSKEKLEYDHIIPVSKGGSNTERNIQLLCEKCNRRKSAKIE